MHDPRSLYTFQRISLAAILLLAFSLQTVGGNPACAAPSERLTPIVKAIRGCSPAVVDIQGQKSVNKTADGTPSPPRQVNGMGTGVVIDSRGYILTNHHVVDGVRRINVTLESGRTYVAKIVAFDKETDLAVILIHTPKPLPVIQLGSSHDLMVGETVIAVGNAYGYDHTVTLGIISALHRNVQVNETQQYLDLIQTDASINPGNSGGPLLNINGEMIGVNVAVRAGAQGIGFAIPVNKALDIAARLLNIEKLENHWHGMTALSIDGPTGPVTIARIARESPAQQSGLQRGDRLERIGSTPIHRAMDVERALLGRRTGESVPVVVRRDGESIELNISLANRATRRPRQTASTTKTSTATVSSAKDSLQDETWKTLGLRLETAPRNLFRNSETPYQGGMRVVTVKPDSSAAKQGVRAGDVLVRMHRWSTASSKDIRFILDRADSLARAGSVKFYILRGNDTFFGHLAFAGSPSKSRR